MTIGGISRVHKRNRDRLYRLAAELQDMAKGHYPRSFVGEIIEDTEVSAEEENKALQRLQVNVRC